MLLNAEVAVKHRKLYVCSQHFSETDFTSANKTRLNRLAVPKPHTPAPHPHSTSHHEEPTLNSSSSEDLHVLIPSKTYSKISITSRTEEPIPIQSDPISSSSLFRDHSLAAETSTFSKEDAFFYLGSESASGEELGSINLQSSPPKRKAWHSLIKELGLDRVGKLTPRRKKLYDRIRTKESALSKLRKKYTTENLKEVCQLDSHSLMRSLSSSLNPHT
jgi:hypothetical protein